MHKTVSLSTGTKRKGETPAGSVKMASVIGSVRRINCRDLSAEACRNVRTLTALVSMRLSEFEKSDACYRFVSYHLQEQFGKNVLSSTKCAHETADGGG
jgi:hypothetical protein